MKYLKVYENFNSKKTEIDNFCKKFDIRNYTINKDYSIDVDGDVSIEPLYSNVKLFKIPIKFNKVYGSFSCNDNALTSLEGCPEWVELSFSCSHNKLTNLNYCPKHVGTYFYCSYNVINTLEYLPTYIGDEFNCSNNKIDKVSLELYQIVDGDIVISSNPITIISPTNKDIQYWDSPLDNLVHYLLKGLYKELSNKYDISTKSKAREKIIDLLDEFEVIEYKELDLISLNSLFDYIGFEFEEEAIKEEITDLGYEIY